MPKPPVWIALTIMHMQVISPTIPDIFMIVYYVSCCKAVSSLRQLSFFSIYFSIIAPP